MDKSLIENHSLQHFITAISSLRLRVYSGFLKKMVDSSPLRNVSSEGRNVGCCYLCQYIRGLGAIKLFISRVGQLDHAHPTIHRPKKLEVRLERHLELGNFVRNKDSVKATDSTEWPNRGLS